MTVTTGVVAPDVVRQSDCLIIANPAAAGVDAEIVGEIGARLGTSPARRASSGRPQPATPPTWSAANATRASSSRSAGTAR